MTVGILVFPGTNGDQDLYHGIVDVLGGEADLVDYRETDLSAYEAIFLPGGFSYGDYLRSGVLAAVSPVMSAVRAFAASGKPVIGICNGFQMLTEMRLLPGSLQKNENLKFISQLEPLRVESADTPFTSDFTPGDIVHLPIAHGEGNYYCDEETYEQLVKNKQIVLTYVDNPNGSVHDIAGICNEERNVIGMMPHPERGMEEILGSADGKAFFTALLKNMDA